MPERGEVWLEKPASDLVGHEQQGHRPVVIVSGSGINSGPWPLVVVVPLTSRDRGIPLHVSIDPPEGGLRTRSYALVEQIHVANRQRLTERQGVLSQPIMRRIDEHLRIVLDLD